VPKIAAEVLIERLADWGVDTVFGLPGDGINGIMEGLRRQQDRVKFVLVHHEESAAFMATGYAKATGRLGVCLATSGPGGIHLLNGLYDAKLDHAPVLAITGMQETSVLGTAHQQEVDLARLFSDVAAYSETVMTPAQLPTLVDVAARTALARRGVAHLTMPNDLQIAEADDELVGPIGPVRAPSTATEFLPASGLPRDADIAAAADVLNRGRKIGILAGIGALHARRELEEVAAALDAPVVKTLPGKAVLPDDSPYTTGGLGLLGTRPSEELMDEIDTLLMVGTNFPYTKHLPDPETTTVVQIEADPVRAGVRIPTSIPLVADARSGLSALLPLLDTRPHDVLQDFQRRMVMWREGLEALEDPAREPIAPQYLAGLLNRMATDDAVLTCDSGTVATWAARHFDIRGDRQFYLSSNLATMACGLPYALAIQHAFPGRQIIAYVGDGGFAMLMAEVMTAVRYDLPVKVVINNNHSLGQILWEQIVLGYPEHGVRFGHPETDYSAWARSCGCYGAKVSDPGDLEGTLREALEFSGPAVLDVNVDPDEPPMPPKIEYEQAKKFALSFFKGQPRRASIANTLFKDKIQQLRNR
jgi:pyruvate dehydrogenase (quinone)/pyruvate oxidase